MTDHRPETTLEPGAPARRRRGHRPLRLLLLTAGLLLALLLIAAAVLVFKPSLVVEQIKNRALPAVSERIGRQVTAGEIDVSFFPPHATVASVKVAGAPGEPPLLESGSSRVTWKLWPLIRSLGRDIRIDAVTLNEPVLTLVRRPDGTWSHEDITRRLEETSPPEAPERSYQVSRFRLEDGQVRVIDQGAGARPARIALTQLDLEADDLAPGKPVELELQGAFAAAKQNLRATFNVDPATEPTTVSGRYALDDVPLQAFRAYFPASMGQIVTGGLIALEGKLDTREGNYVSDGKARLGSVRLRGEPASGDATFRATVNAANTDALVVNIDALSLKGPGVDLAGTARYQHSPRRAEFALEGPLLDLEQVMGVMPPEEAPAQAGASPGAPEPLLSASARQQLEATTVNGTLQVDKVVNGKLTATDFRAKATLKRGLLVLEDATANLYGGKVSATGTRVDLLPAQPKWSLAANVEGMEVGQAMASLSQQQPLQGKMSLSLSANGVGNEWTQVKKLVTGDGVLQLREGALTSANLGEQLREPLAKGLARFGAKGVAQTVARGGTELKDLSAAFQVRDGWLMLTGPLRFNSQFGTAQLAGRIGLDKQLDLEGTALLEPSFIAAITGNTYRPDKPLAVPLQIGGDLTGPKITGVDTRQLVTSAVPTEKAKQLANEQAKQAEEEVKKRARKGLEGLFRR